MISQMGASGGPRELLAEGVAAALLVLCSGAAVAGLIGSGRGWFAEGLWFVLVEFAFEGVDGFVDGGLWRSRGLAWLEATEGTVDAEPHLLEDDFVALELAVGLGGGELFVDFDL